MPELQAVMLQHVKYYVQNAFAMLLLLSVAQKLGGFVLDEHP